MDVNARGPGPGFFSAVVRGELYAWGGKTGDYFGQKVSCVYRFNHLGEWTEQECGGQPPTCLYWGASAATDHHLYQYGGYDGSNWYTSLHQLDVTTWTWRQLAADGPRISSLWNVKMLVYGSKLVLFGADYGFLGGIKFTEENKLYIFDLSLEEGK